MVKDIVKKEDQKIKDKDRASTSRHRKSSLVVHPDQLPILRVISRLDYVDDEPPCQDKSPSRQQQYATLPHSVTRKSHSVSHGPGPGAAARTNVQKRRRKSHGLTIKIESPTTGEDSSAGIIDTGSGLDSSPSNIYLSGDTTRPGL